MDCSCTTTITEIRPVYPFALISASASPGSLRSGYGKARSVGYLGSRDSTGAAHWPHTSACGAETTRIVGSAAPGLEKNSRTVTRDEVLMAGAKGEVAVILCRRARGHLAYTVATAVEMAAPKESGLLPALDDVRFTGTINAVVLR